ncbi:MAG: putative sugar nucleotidyl transferase [Pirellulaceae bacterium]
MHCLIFEDQAVQNLEPVTLMRPAYRMTCGGGQLIELAERLTPATSVIVRNHLKAIAALDDRIADRPMGTKLLIMNARLVPSPRTFRTLQNMIRADSASIAIVDNQIAAAFLPEGLTDSDRMQFGQFEEYLGQLPLRMIATDLALIDRPYQLVQKHLTTLTDTLNDRIASAEFHEIADGVFARPGFTLDASHHLDTQHGPILLENGVKLGSHLVIRGPVFLDRNAVVNDHASVYEHVYVGKNSKVGGELVASVLEDYSNKQHHGFLGHSYLGSWVNLGAGTSNSNLKNTYGEVRMGERDHRIATGMQFLGCVMGDYSKAAINTSIFTGVTIGVCSMLYGFILSNVASFCNSAPSIGGLTTSIPAEVVIEVQKRMFRRRGIEQQSAHVQLIRDVHQIVCQERDLPCRSPFVHEEEFQAQGMLGSP